MINKVLFIKKRNNKKSIIIFVGSTLLLTFILFYSQIKPNIFNLSNNKIGILGRVYIANEGINAQISIPENNIEKFKLNLHSYLPFKNIQFKFAVIDGISFIKLTIK